MLAALQSGQADTLLGSSDSSAVEIYRVISEQQEAERTELIRRLEHLSRIKSDFLALVSHELRTPLAILQEAVNLILDGLVGRCDEGVKACLVMAQSNILRLGAIVNDLLDMAALEAGRLKVTKEKENIQLLVEDSLKTFQSSAGEKQVRLSFETGKDAVYYAPVDRNRILQVLTNLFGNALKFVRPGEGIIQARVLRENGWIRIEIEDNGCGIRKEDKEKVFQRFEQAGGRGPAPAGGTGLGLAIAKEIVELHGGRMGVSSEYGKGSTFFFLLPTASRELPDRQ
ncbi:HAMP domain-containing histidine kinase [Acidobacteriia bacterium AH_259_A11_L15]|nr:HAMP domain-containing histidine kinase [Acidobacteriia bacterium AH_259_A11_L15]